MPSLPRATPNPQFLTIALILLISLLFCADINAGGDDLDGHLPSLDQRQHGNGLVTKASEEEAIYVDSFFSSVDTDGDGQIQDSEVREYLRGNLGVASEDEVAEATRLVQSLDNKDDEDDTVSRAEVEYHLQHMVQGHRIVEWVTHGLELPKYASAFRENGITGYELAQLIKEDGRILKEMGVSFDLHRRKIIQGINRLMLGAGRPPSAPRDLKCMPLACGSVRLTWQSPASPGTPPMHKVVLYRRLAGSGAAWQQVPVNLTSDDDSYDDDVAAAAATATASAAAAALWVGAPVQYRMHAWNLFDRGASARTGPCDVGSKCSAALPAPAATAAGGGGDGGWWVYCATPLVMLATMLLRSWRVQRLAVTVIAKALELLGFGSAAQALAAHQRNQGPHPDPPPSAQHHLSHAFSRSLSRRLHSQTMTLARQVSGGFRSLLSSHSMPPDVLLSPSTSMASSYAAAAAMPSGAPTAAVLNASLGGSFGAMPTGGSGAGSGVGMLPPPLASRSLDHRGSGNGSNNSRASARWLMRSASNLSTGSADLGGGQPQAGGDPMAGDLPGAAAGLSAPSEQSSEEVGGADTGGGSQRQQHKNRNECSHPGCKNKVRMGVGLAKVKVFTSHYCGECQAYVCSSHTRISAHGSSGDCGVESRCVCAACFLTFEPAKQAAYLKLNRLKDSRGGSANGHGSTGSLHDMGEQGVAALEAAAAASAVGGTAAGAVAGEEGGGAGGGGVRPSNSHGPLPRKATKAKGGLLGLLAKGSFGSKLDKSDGSGTGGVKGPDGRA